jgi:transcriptional regulator with XRE-family HTH domain
MEINKLLDDCMAKVGAKTDYQLWQKTGIPRARISNYRSGERMPDAYACSKIAEILGMDEMMLIAHFEGMSAKNPQVKEYWQKKLERLGGMAAAILIAFVTLIVTLGTPAPAQAAPLLASQGVNNSLLSLAIHYTNSARRKIRAIKELLLSVVKIKSFGGGPVPQV